MSWSVSNTSGCLYIVATPIGNLQDISARALSTLQRVDCIVAEDTRHSRKLLRHFGIDKPLLALHDHNEQRMQEPLLARLLGGEQMALVSDAGTPLISDPGYALVRACRRQNIAVVPIPGASALITALCVAGLPTDRFYFAGFLPRKSTLRQETLGELKTQTATLVFYESAHRILDCLADMAAVLGGQRQAVCARELTKRHETLLSGSLYELHQRITTDTQQKKGEFVLLLAGAEKMQSVDDLELDRCLKILLTELPVKQAAGLATQLLGVKKNQVYQRALELRSCVNRVRED
jgi:16S rRNA (cytidine1402-2'-O)-methyltransferase